MSFVDDLKFACRQARKNPGFIAIAVLVLGLGIGVSTAAFTLFDAILLRPLPVRDPGQLVFASNGTHPHFGEFFSYPAYESFRDHAQSLSGVAAAMLVSQRLIASGVDENNGMPVRYDAVSGNFFSVLGVPPLLGRTIAPDDDRKDAPRAVAVLSYPFWQRYFGADPGAIGKTFLLNNAPFTIIGIAPSRFFGFEPGARIDFWIPIGAVPAPGWNQLLHYPTLPQLQIFGRLRPGVKRAAASAELDALYQGLADDNRLPAAQRKIFWGKLNLQPGMNGRLRLGLDGRGGGIRQMLLSLMSVAGLVLLIACTNVGSLLLAHTAVRQRELAIRAALGARRGRLIRQLFTEGILLSAAGGAVGVLTVHWFTNALASYFIGPSDSPISLAPDAAILLFAVGVTAVTGIFVGLIPALRFSQIDLVSAVNSQSHAAASGSRQRLSRALVIAQIGVSVCLLAGGGLLIRSAHALKNVDLGFNQKNLLFVRVGLPGYDTGLRVNLTKDLLSALGALPGVRSATLSGGGLSGGQNDTPFLLNSIWVEGYVSQPGEQMEAHLTDAGPHYFENMGIPLLRGRGFGAADVFPWPWNSPKPLAGTVVVISEAFARKYFGSADPVGRHITFSAIKHAEIVGVAKNIKFANLRDNNQLLIFSPDIPTDDISIALRTSEDPAALAPSVRTAIKRAAPHAPIRNLETMDDVLDQQLFQERITAEVAGYCSAFALTLACMGLFGLLSYNVAQRTQEIGVRIALGADGRKIVLLIVRQAMGLALAGCALGVAGALALTHVIANKLYGVSATDPVTFLFTVAVLLLVAALACWLPARRATKVDPMIALRAE